MKAVELINNALYKADIVGRSLETASGTEVEDGRRELNKLLANKSISGSRLPYVAHTSFTAVVGQEVTFVAGLIDLDVLTFNIDNVRFPMKRDSQRRYFATGRVDDIKSLPFHYFSERVAGGTNIYLYFVPADNYPINITGKFSFTLINDVNEDLPTDIELFYQDYLELALAKRMCGLYNMAFSPYLEQELTVVEYEMLELSKRDFSIRKSSMLRSKNPFKWGQANLGWGWTTP
jgi:hypothetical protein